QAAIWAMVVLGAGPMVLLPRIPQATATATGPGRAANLPFTPIIGVWLFCAAASSAAIAAIEIGAVSMAVSFGLAPSWGVVFPLAGDGPPGAARASCRGVRPAAIRQRAGHHHLQRADRPGLPGRDLRGGAGDDERGDPGDRLGVHRRPAARASPARTAGRARWVRTGTGMSTDEASVSPLVRRI